MQPGLSEKKDISSDFGPVTLTPATLVYHNKEKMLSSVSGPRKHNDEILWPDQVRMNLEYYHNHSFTGDL